MKKYYSSIHIDKKGSIDNLNYYATNIWHPQFQEPDGKFKLSAPRIRDTHRELYSALLALTISKVVARRNKLNEISDKHIPYNITKPIELKVQPYEIRAMVVQGLKNAMSLQTIKNRMDRLEKAGFISRSWLRSEGMFSVLIYPQFLALKTPETGEIIKTNDFEKTSKSINCKSKNENFTNITNTYTNTDNKIIQDEPVNKRSFAPSSLKNEHPKEKNKTVQIDNVPFQQKNSGTFNNLSDCEKQDIAGERIDDKTREKDRKLAAAKKKAANKFYTNFIQAFWSHLASMYLLNLAPRQTFHYAVQSIETLINDNWYFGACSTVEAVNYQYNKLEKTLKSTMRLVASRKKENPRFTMDHIYPNTFLKEPPEKGHMRFKNSVIHMEFFMQTHDQMQYLIEKNLQKERDKVQKTRFNLIVSNIIAWIMLNGKENTIQMTEQANNYLREIHPDLTMKLYTDFKNPYLVKQILAENKKTGFDYDIINECFTTAEQLKAEIDKLLPEMQKRLRYGKVDVHNQKINIHFKIRGAEMKPIPKHYSKHTLKLLQYYTR